MSAPDEPLPAPHPLAGRPWALLRCGVVADESDAFLRGHPHPPCALETFESGLHLQPLTMRNAVQARIEAIEAAHAPEFIVLLFGLCGNAAVGLHGRTASLVLPRAHDCTTLFLGGIAAHEALRKTHPSCLFCTPGWYKTGMLPSGALLEKMKAHYRDLYPDDPTRADDLYAAFCDQYKGYDGYYYVDFGAPETAVYREEARRCAGELGWGFESARGDERLLRAALEGRWDARDFLIVPPGYAVAPCWQGGIVKAVPAACA